MSCANIARIIVLALLAVTGLVNSEINSEGSNLFNQQNTGLDDEKHVSDERLTQTESAKLKKMFRFAFNIGETPMAPLLNGAEMPDVRKLQELGLIELVTMLKEDPEKREQFFAQLVETVEKDELIPYHNENLAPDGGRRMTEGKTACEIDYGAFVEPITDKIYNFLRQLCIDKNWNPFCRFLPELPDPPMPSWGKRMIDSMGKIPSGLAEGALHWVGAYEKCLDTYISYENTNRDVPEEREFHGQYCRLTMRTKEAVLSNRTIPLYLGLCVPDTCSPEDVISYIGNNLVLNATLFVVMGMDIVRIYCGQETDYSSDIGMQATVGLVLGLLVLVLLATLYDGILRKRWLEKYVDDLPKPGPSTPPDSPFSLTRKPAEGIQNRGFEGYVECVALEKPHPSVTVNINNDATGNNLKSQMSTSSSRPLFTADIEKEYRLSCTERLEMAFVGFSAYTNFRRIWRYSQKETHIPILNGVRTLTLCWTILGFSWLLGPLYAETWTTCNLYPALRTYPKKWSFQPILNFHFSSDSYFFLSGFLATYWWLIRHAKVGKLTWCMPFRYIIHKYWRLIPTLMVFLAVYACSYRYLASGPLYPKDIADADQCRAGGWWRNLLLVNNLATEDSCLVFLWFLPVVFQLNLVALVALIPLVIKPIVGYIMMAAMFVSFIGATAGVSSRIHGQDERSLDWFMDYFMTPWCRAGPYIIGMACGKVLFEIRGRKNIVMHPIAAILGWSVGLGLLCTPIYVTYDFMREGGEMWGQSEWVAYDTMARSSWALGLAWVVFACQVGYGGLITKFLAYPMWLPFSRIGYTTMMVCASVVFVHIYSLHQCVYIGTTEQLYRWFANTVLSIFVGTIIAILWHYPLSIGLEKAIVCNSKLKWLKSGRHPREKVAALENAFNMPSYQESQEEQVGQLHQNMTSQISNNPVYGLAESSVSGLHKREVKKKDLKATSGKPNECDRGSLTAL